MKKLVLFSFAILLIAACKKTEFSPEGPTDVRIRNLTGYNLIEVNLKTSEYEEDVDDLGDIQNGATSNYSRMKKAYPNIEISAKIIIGGSLVTFSTGIVDFTYLHYIGQDRVTYVIGISDLANRKLIINSRIVEEPLVLE